MIRKTRNLLLSLAALVLVAGALAAVRIGGRSEEPEIAKQVPRSVTLSDFIPSDLRSVIAENPDGTLQMYSSDGENWMIADVPRYYRSNLAELTSTIRAFSRIYSSSVVAEGVSGAQLSEYGLEPPEATLTIRDREGGNAVLEIGAPSPSGSGRYARNAGSDTVVLMPSRIAGRAFGTAGDYRDLSLPSINPEKLAGLSFRSGGTTFLAEPRAEDNPFVSHVGPFDVISPFRGRYAMDDFTIQKKLTEETPLPVEVKAYLDELDPADPQLGLDPETADRLYISDTDGAVLSLIIGASDGQGARYGMFGDRDDAVFLIEESDIGFIRSDPFSLISKFIFLGSILDVSRVKVERGLDTYIMGREELGDAEDSKDDRFMINELEVGHKEFTGTYEKFISLMWEGEIEKDTPLGAPDIRITISNVKSGVENAVIRFWPYDEVYYQATVGDQPLEFLVGRYQVEDFIDDLAALSEYSG